MFNSLRSVSGSSTSGASASASSSGTNTTATPTASSGLGVQHPLLAAGGGLSRRESLENRGGHRASSDTSAGGGGGDVPMPSAAAPVTLPYKPRQRHSHSASGSGLLTSGTVSSTHTSGTVPLASPASANGLSTPPIINEQQPGQGAAITGLTASHNTYVTAAPFQAGGSHSGGGGGAGMARASVTSRLQLQRLKAAAQKAGLVGDGKAEGGASVSPRLTQPILRVIAICLCLFLVVCEMSDAIARNEDARSRCGARAERAEDGKGMGGCRRLLREGELPVRFAYSASVGRMRYRGIFGFGLSRAFLPISS